MSASGRVKWWLATVAYAVLLSTGCSEHTSTSASEVRIDTDGPVSILTDKSMHQMAGFSADAGEVLVFGAVVISTSGEQDVTLDAAVLNGDVDPGSAAVREVRVRELGPGGGETVGAAKWPYEHYEAQSEPIQGHVMAPKDQVDLLFIVEVKETGIWRWPSTRVLYSVGGDSYEDSAPLGFEVCPTERAC